MRNHIFIFVMRAWLTRLGVFSFFVLTKGSQVLFFEKSLHYKVCVKIFFTATNLGDSIKTYW